eukprot:TRINITY_DN2040_c0_g1_i2.p1 TRINITY_DN2040_c0_g1~~TRINITY_DN2040_c0_g1_i2.p1  ORF type:complete len:864 (-),score=185.58 TRINITY_DN2040_c0_g1_i2:130-2721(-)
MDRSTVVTANPIFWMSGTSLFDQTKFLESCRIFEKLPPNSKTLYNVGVCLLHIGDYRGAVTAFRGSIEHDKLFTAAYFQLAYAFYMLHDFHAAVKNFEATMMFLSNTEELRFHHIGLRCTLLRSEVLFNLALSLRSAGNQDAASRAINQVRCCHLQSPAADIEVLLSKLESGWVQDVVPFQANLKAIFRSPVLPSLMPRSRSHSRGERLSPVTSRDVVAMSKRPVPTRQPPPPPGAYAPSPNQSIRIGDGKLRSRSESPLFPEPMAEVKPRSGSEISLPRPFGRESLEKRRISKEEKKMLQEEQKRIKEEAKEEKKRQKEERKRSGSLNKLITKSGSPVQQQDLERHNSLPQISAVQNFTDSNLNILKRAVSQDASDRPFNLAFGRLNVVDNSPNSSRQPSPRNTFANVQPDPWEINFQEIHLQHEIGRGAFGRVYQGTWRNAPCCVKVANPETSRDSMFEFIKEANSMKRMRSHPNVCQLFGVCTTPTVCIVMELLPEGSLFDMIHNAQIDIDLDTALAFLKDVCSGMLHLHAEGILHLDLATRNLLMKSERSSNGTKYSVKISDFGMSSSLTTTESVYDVSARSKFPIRWCAPEIASHRQVTKASDVWSFGVVAWEILERKFPYADMSNQEVIEAVFNQGYRLPKPTRIGFPNELYQLMLWCWQMDTNKRPTFAKIYEDLLAIERKADMLKKAALMDGRTAESLSHANYGPIWSHVPGNAGLPPNVAIPTSQVVANSYSTMSVPSTNVAGHNSPRSNYGNPMLGNAPKPGSPRTYHDAPAHIYDDAETYPDGPLIPPYSPPPPPHFALSRKISDVAAPISRSDSGSSSIPGSPPPVKRFCASCGKGIKPIDCFCSYCGHKL